MQVDRSLRSVFVGNIPYDATEEKLRDIFSAVGPVLSFRIVFDRETGKPKGYGFCEYKDQETATSAIRNLNGYDLGGRQLRVDSASNERARDEPTTDQQQQQQQQQHQQQQQQQYQQQNQQTAPSDNLQLNQLQQQQQQVQPVVDGQTVINNVLQCSPPEQLFDVCKQLKASLLINPNETRQLLVQNPQLSYAVLQSLVMIKAIDVETVFDLLHKGLVQAPLQTMMAAPMTQMPAMPTMPAMAPMAPMAPMPPMQQLPSVPTMPTMSSLPLNQIAPGPIPAASYDPRLTAVDPRLARQQQQQAGPQPPPQWPSASM